MGARPLPQARGAAIGRQHVRVAVLVERAGSAGIERVEPGAGRELDHAGTQRIRHAQAGEAGAAVVEDPDDVAISQAPAGRVLRVHAHRLAPGDLAVASMAAVIVLLCSLVTGWFEIRCSGKRRRGCAQPLLRGQPGGVAEAILVAEAGDPLRVKLDQSRGRRQRMRLRIGPKSASSAFTTSGSGKSVTPWRQKASKSGMSRYRRALRWRASP